MNLGRHIHDGVQRNGEPWHITEHCTIEEHARNTRLIALQRIQRLQRCVWCILMKYVAHLQLLDWAW